MIRIKKAAMFGLDARIALAIFGALSVISGAALYSAIQSAKTEQYRQNFEELIKASEQYYLDNFSPLPEASSGILWASDLVNNRQNINTWKGPYFDGASYGGQCIKNTFTNNLHSSIYECLYLQKKSDWLFYSSPQYCVINDNDCALSIVLAAGGANTDGETVILKMFNLLDKNIDNGDGNRKGKIRYINSSNAGQDRMVYIAYPQVRRK